jgi:hypothetical protein
MLAPTPILEAVFLLVFRLPMHARKERLTRPTTSSGPGT